MYCLHCLDLKNYISDDLHACHAYHDYACNFIEIFVCVYHGLLKNVIQVRSDTTKYNVDHCAQENIPSRVQNVLDDLGTCKSKINRTISISSYTNYSVSLLIVETTTALRNNDLGFTCTTYILHTF